MQSIVKGALALSLGLSALSAVPAMAQQANQFAGFNVGGALSYRHTKIDMKGFLNSSPSADDGAASLDVSYAFALSPQWSLALGGTYDLNKTDGGSVSYRDGSRTGNVSVKLKNHWSLYLAPGYAFAKDWQVYGKLAYHRAQGEYTDSLFPSGTTSHDGFGYGVGVNYAATRNLRVGVELQRVNFSREQGNESSGKPEMTEVAFKLGYQF
ncbi:outer membrane beta-barrel protein [Herbaspirillum sp.]|uniref:outer membrane protein n=1 Tax=Herbaspirillum sp. TaxID=1890675 RepID=UPI0031DB3525